MKRTLTALILCLFTGITAHSTQHILEFGTSGNTYNPATLTVEVGDVLTWVGSFATHPMESTSVPSGAASFSNNSGSEFSYTVTHAGTYNYHCTNHVGMVGSFTAVLVGIQPVSPLSGIKVFPTLTTGMINLDFTGFTTGENFNIDVFTLAGQKVFATTGRATSLATLDVTSLQNGIYLVAIRDENERLALRRIVKN